MKKTEKNKKGMEKKEESSVETIINFLLVTLLLVIINPVVAISPCVSYVVLLFFDQYCLKRVFSIAVNKQHQEYCKVNQC